MDPQRKGDITEERGAQAARELRERYPDFVLSHRQASPEMDARGIDYLVEISLPKGGEKRRMTVPMEFKSSERGVRKWKVVHRDLDDAGVLIFHIHPSWYTPHKLRRLMFRALKRVQKNSRGGMLYHGMWQRLFVGGSRNLRNLRRIVRKIKERRASKRR